MTINSTTRFSDRVKNYVKYRPGYPLEILSFLEKEFSFNHTMRVADIGSGTGILTKLFLQNGNSVDAVEPNEAMRKAAEETLKTYTGFISITGTAGQTGLPDESVDLITAGQAFHWFDPVKTKKEFKRIAKENTYVVLIWNERQIKSAFEQDYERFLLYYATDYTKVDHRNITNEKISAFFEPNPFEFQNFNNEQLFDFEGLKGRLLSSSYIPNTAHPSYQEMIMALHQLFEKYERAGKIKLEYETKVYVGKIK